MKHATNWLNQANSIQSKKKRSRIAGYRDSLGEDWSRNGLDLVLQALQFLDLQQGRVELLLQGAAAFQFLLLNLEAMQQLRFANLEKVQDNRIIK